MTPITPEKSNFFARRNYDVGNGDDAHRDTVGQEQALKVTAHGDLAMIEQAIAGVEQGDQAEAALRALCASLLEIRALRARDPGIRIAAEDLYEAAAALLLDKRAGAVVVDIRRWRLLKEADGRLRRRPEASSSTSVQGP